MTAKDTSGGVHAAPPQTSAERNWKWRLTLVAAASLALTVFTAIVFTIGYQFGGASKPSAIAEQSTTPVTWTCSMHPQVKLPKPGPCPICFMDLIPLAESTAGSGHPRELTMTPAAMALADIQTAPVRRQFVTNTIRMVGKVDYDETKLATITAWVSGRLDRLFIDYTGVTVCKGDHLVEIYSPDLIIAQRQLIQAATNAAKPGQRDDRLAAATLKSTEEKLRLWGLTDEQIEAIKQRGTPANRVTIYAPIGGVVVHKDASEGMNVQTGTRLYTIADLSQVWVYIDAYESDVAWIRYGQGVEFTTESYPGDIFTGRVSFIDPVLNERTRTVRVRVNVANDDGRLKPGMFVRATVMSQLAQGGQVIDASLAGKWVSPHHPEIIRDAPGTCPICGIDLVPAEELGFVQADAGAKPPLVIPASAPLLTGPRAVVYVKAASGQAPTFQGREVLLGARVSPPPGAELPGYSGDYYIVRHGLSEGEEVVTNGNFKIDSALQIAAKPSMMSPPVGGIDRGREHEADRSRDQLSNSVGGQHLDQFEVPSQFRVSLDPHYRAYLAISDALANDDLAAARQQLQELLKASASIDSTLLEKQGRGRWKTLSDKIIFATHAALDSTDREATRRNFEQLSNCFASLVQEFGHALPQPMYQLHCPMAFKNAGASWLQATSQTRNPYFGPAMLICGDVMATFHSQAPLDVPASFRDQLAVLYHGYLQLQVKLAADDGEGASLAARALRTALEAIDASVLDEKPRQSWTVVHKQLSDELRVDPQVNLTQLRLQFEALSLTMLGLVENFGHSQAQPLYKAFCPMAFDNKGAAWLQADETIANPYFGAQMLRCGSVQRAYEPAVAGSAAGELGESDPANHEEGLQESVR